MHTHITHAYMPTMQNTDRFSLTHAHIYTRKTLSYTHVCNMSYTHIYIHYTHSTLKHMHKYAHHMDTPTCAHTHMHAYFLSCVYYDKLLIPPPRDEVNLKCQAKSFPHALKGYANFPLVLISQQNPFQS